MIEYSPLKPKGYRPRLVDSLVRKRLTEFGAVEIRGTRWSGKSWTASAFAESVTRVDTNAALYREDPDLALIGARPHAIDEWQDAPAIWNHVRHEIDDSANQPGQFILTGSSAPADKEDRHSGAGRISRIRMRTMTLSESGHSHPSVSLAGLFSGEFEPGSSHLGLADYARIICQGGWPALLGATAERAATTIDEYLDLLFSVSMRKLGKDPVLARRIAMSLARNIGTSATLKTLGADCAAGEKKGPSEDTVASYLSDFALNYFLDELPGWDAPVKARSRVRTKPKRYLDDPSMAAALLSVSPDRLLENGQLLGMLFEALCVHDLSVYVSLLPDAGFQPVRYYSDADGLEVDIIIELRDGRWAALEVKLGETKVEEGAKNLERLATKVGANPAARNREPEFLAVVVAKGTFARRRKEDGVYVLPLDTLTA
ncbi:MAG TPA: AAA family ATPase [Coriobacteriia bacterium]|nr:AAA family ATPase [Coriobacteriia bacterium]